MSRVVVLGIVARAAGSFYEELPLHVVSGLAHLLAWLLIVPGPFMLSGIYAIGQKAVRGIGASWSTVWSGVREFGGRSLLLAVVIVAGYAIVAGNLWFYNTPGLSPFPATVTSLATPLFVLLGLVWTGIAFYAQSFLMELERPGLRVALRNSFYLTAVRPLQTLFLVFVALIALAISLAIPLLLVLLPGFLSTLSLTAVRALVAGAAQESGRGSVDGPEREA